MREPILSETDSAPAAWQEPNRSGGAGRKRGVGKMNARPALALNADGICANETGAPLLYQYIKSIS